MSKERKLTLDIRKINLKVLKRIINEEDLKSVSLIGINLVKREIEGMSSGHVPDEFVWMAADEKNKLLIVIQETHDPLYPEE